MFSAMPGYEAVAGAPGDVNPNWSNVVLGLHCDGSNGSTTITDEKGHTLTRIGTPTISTARSQFGGASLLLSGDGGITVGGNAYNPDFDFGTGDFCIRLWAYQTTAGASQSLFDGRLSAGDANGLIIWLNAGKLSVYSGTTFYTADGANFPLNAMTHVEVGRASGGLYTFKNGVAVTSNNPFTANLNDGRCFIGQANSGGGGGYGWTGNLDDIQIIKGQALHTAAFTPPIAAFPNS